MSDYLAGVDVGTTGARCMIFDLRGNPLAGHYCDYGASYPRPGWVEQDSKLLIDKAMQVCRATIDLSGIDPRRILGALLANLRAGSIRQGGSTLTQQFVKNFFLTPEKTLQRKVQEAAMALLVELRYDKRSILQM